MPSQLLRDSKRDSVGRQLTELARRLGPGQRLPGVRELRSHLGVSQTTLDAAFGDLEARRIVERRHGSGIYVSAQLLRRAIALVCRPEFFCAVGSSPFWGLLLREAHRRVEKTGEELHFYFAEPVLSALPESLCAQIGHGRLHGVIGIGLSHASIDTLAITGIPVVAFAGPGVLTVRTPQEETARLGVRSLAALGCRRIAHWQGVFLADDDTGSDTTQAMFARALEDSGLPRIPELIRRWPADATDSLPALQEQGYRLAIETFSQPRATWPDAIVSEDDMLTLGALAALTELGIEVGTTVRIATLANAGSPALLGWERRLIRIEVDPAQVVSRLFQALEDAIERRLVAGDLVVPARLRLPKETA
jgi:DNA-binding LacI/PurR family transcriptional regulator